MNRSTVKYLYMGIILVLASLLLSVFTDRPTDEEEVKEEFQASLLAAEQQRDDFMTAVLKSGSLHNGDSLFAHFIDPDNDLSEDKGTGLVVYRNNRLIFWSDNDIAVPKLLTEGLFDQPYIFLRNGWYDIRKITAGEVTIVGFILVERKYSHENQYLQNQLAESFYHPAIRELKRADEPAQENDIYNSEGTYLFSLVLRSSNRHVELLHVWTILLLLLGLGCLMRAAELWALGSLPLIPPGKTLLFLLFLGGVRGCMIHFQFPDLLYDTALFDPTFYAHSYFFPSAGDLFINAIMAVYMAYLIDRCRWPDLTGRIFTGRIGHVLLLVVSVQFLLTLAYFVTQIVKGGVENSTINFDVSDIFKLSYFSYLGLISFALLFFAFLITLNKVNGMLLRAGFRWSWLALTYVLIALLNFFIAYYPSLSWHKALDALWTLPIFVAVILFKAGGRRNYSFSVLVLLVLLFAAAASFIIVEGSSNRELNERRYLAGKLSTNTDPAAEYLFTELKPVISGDSLIAQHIFNYWMGEERIRQHLVKKYFSGYWDKYDFEFVGCSAEDSILIAPQNLSDHCWSYFESKIKNEMEPTAYKDLFHLPNNNAIASYLGRVEVGNNGSERAYLFIEFRSKPFIKSEGYPELLLGQKEIDRTLDLENYSFARYQQGQLINSAGEYHYPMVYEFHHKGRYSIIEDEAYSHLLYEAGEDSSLILSRKDNTAIQIAILFSFLFSMFSLLFFALGIMINRFPLYYNFSFLSFGSKLQLILVGVILFVIIPFGIGVTYYIKVHYQERNERTLTEKVRSVLTEVEHKIGNEEFLPPDMPPYFGDYLNQILIKFSNVFYTDINLYGLSGQLLATSRSEVFDIGLKSKQMDVEAYRQMIINRKSLFIHTEKIGELSYLSAYVPFRNNENELLAYLNLPYFAKQNELEKDLGGFLIALVNSYIFLIALAIIMAVVFADYLSRPLKLISSKIRQLKLGGENELIQWEGDDEIGVLVNEYNRMVRELARNVQLLARSEREGAWREMAKQVAHEIKNPLTPMKLSVQHLKRSFDSNAENIEDQVTKVSNTLIEQIDSLTRIADEFSNFAKMPATRKEKLDVREVAESSMNLFREAAVDLQLEAEADTRGVMIEADRDQLMRAFTNIIKNAIQSVPDEKEGRIRVLIKRVEGKIQIQISDNGKGISEEEQRKIFVPNFTTKSGGMGLGLAMVKNIVENSNGMVFFQSTLGEGTTFYIEFPIPEE